jgi:hypothetical protein
MYMNIHMCICIYLYIYIHQDVNICMLIYKYVNIYSMRDKLDGNLKRFIADGDKDKLKNMMNDAEEWLYGDGFDSTKKQYSQVDTCQMYVYVCTYLYVYIHVEVCLYTH